MPRVFVQNLYLRLGPRRCGPSPWRARVYPAAGTTREQTRMRESLAAFPRAAGAGEPRRLRVFLRSCNRNDAAGIRADSPLAARARAAAVPRRGERGFFFYGDF